MASPTKRRGRKPPIAARHAAIELLRELRTLVANCEDDQQLDAIGSIFDAVAYMIGTRDEDLIRMKRHTDALSRSFSTFGSSAFWNAEPNGGDQALSSVRMPAMIGNGCIGG